MPFTAIDQIASAVENGQFWQSIYLRTSSNRMFPEWWGDLSIGLGSPISRTYGGTPLAGVPVVTNSQSIDIGPTIPNNQNKYLLTWGMQSNGSGMPATFLLVDLLLYYPFVDTGLTSPQILSNPTALPRYPSGVGVYPTIITTSVLGGTNNIARLNYTNSDGVAGRIADVEIVSTTTLARIIQQAPSGGAFTGKSTPFTNLQDGDKGVRSIESVTMLSSTMSGYVTIALIEVIASLPVSLQNFYTEKNYLRETGTLPEIKNNAALGILFTQQSAAGDLGTTYGMFDFVWG